MTEAAATGKNGKRLWLRSDDGRWIPVPYGAGEDTNIRSLNVYDAATKTWMTPTWGWHVWNRAGINTPVDALDVRAPGVTWLGGQSATSVLPFYNPNYLSKQTTVPFTTMHTNWLRLFHTQQRNDPDWRIVQVGTQQLPTHVPNTPVNYKTTYSSEYLYFWPAVAVNVRNFNRDPDGTVQEYTYFIAGGFGVDNGNVLAAITYATVDDNTSSDSADPTNVETAGMIDLKAIRQRLADDYPQRGIDFVGQYNDISTMTLKRIYVHCRVEFTTIQSAPLDSLVSTDASTFKVFASTSNPGTENSLTDPYWQKTYTVRAPTDRTAEGSVIISKTGAELAEGTTVVPYRNRSRNFDGYLKTTSWSNQDFTLTIENPTTDGISFYGQITNAPVAGNGLDTAVSSIYLYADCISLHYAVAGKDTPTSTHSWDAIG